MAGLNDVIGSVAKGTGSTVTMILIVLVVIILALLLLFGVFSIWWFRRRWNLRVEFKLPRSDGKIINGEWGKGMYNAKRGVIYLKRRKMKTVPMKIVDPKRYLQGTDLLTVIQVGANDYRPVQNESWTEVIIEEINDETGETREIKEAIMNIKADIEEDKAWKSAWEASAKKAYSLVSFFQQFQVPIAIAVVLIAVFVGFAIIWTRLPTICGG